VLAQTRLPDEIVVIDDGSTDETAAAVRPYLNRIRYIYQENRGEPAARNRGIQVSTSAYIAFLDGDDLWVPNKLELQLEYLKQHRVCALVYSDMSTFDENGTIDASVKERFKMQLPSGRMFVDLLKRPIFGSGTVVVRRDCFKQLGGFDEELLVGSDYEMWLRIAREFEIGAVDLPLLKYRYHPAMSTCGTGVKMCNGVPWEVVVVTKMLKLHPNAVAEVGEHVLHRRIAKSYADMARRYFRGNEYKGARRLLLAAVKQWPLNPRYWAFYAT